MKPRLLTEIDAAVASGVKPLITIDPSTEITVRVRKKKTGSYLRTRSGSVMRCRAPGCSRRLRKGAQCITCSTACKNRLYEYVRTVLDVFEGKINVTDFPIWMRSR